MLCYISILAIFCDNLAQMAHAFVEQPIFLKLKKEICSPRC